MKRSLCVVLCCLFATMWGVAEARQTWTPMPGDGSEAGASWLTAPPGTQVTNNLLPDPPAPGCIDGELQTTATATRSGGGSGTLFGPQIANDGTYGPGGQAPVCSPCGYGCWHWTSAGRFPTTSWYQLEWSSPTDVCQIFVDTKPVPGECSCGNNRALHGAYIETWDGSGWVRHGAMTDATDDWGFVLPQCITTTRLRLYGLGVVNTASQASNPCMYELKVYGCGQQGPVTLEQLEAKLDAIEPAVSGLEAKLDAIEGKADAITSQLDDIEDSVSGKASQGSVDAIEAKIDTFEVPSTCDILIELLPFLPGNGELPTTHHCFVPTLGGRRPLPE